MIRKALNYDELKENYFQFIENNQLMFGTFKPLDSDYTEVLAKYKVAQSVVSQFTLHRLPEERLVLRNEQIVGTLRIDRRFELPNTQEATLKM